MSTKFKEIDIPISGKTRKFRINKFDARTGSYVLYMIMSKLLPSLSGLGAGEDGGNKQQPSKAVTQAISSLAMSPDEFRLLQDTALQACEEVLPAGLTPIIGPNGNYAVIGLETEAQAVFVLTLQAVVFNLKGFFTEGGLNLIFSGMAPAGPDIPLPNR